MQKNQEKKINNKLEFHFNLLKLKQGAHYNPAVSLAMLLTNRMKILDFFVYICAQFIGGFFVKKYINLNQLSLLLI